MRAVLVLMLLLTTPSLAELRPVTRAVTVNPTNAALWFPDAEQFGAANEFVRRVESDGGITVFSSGTVVRLHVDIPDVSEFLTQPQADLLYQEIGAGTAASGSVVYATTPGYTAAVEQAASAYGWGDHSAAGYLTEETDTASPRRPAKVQLAEFKTKRMAHAARLEVVRVAAAKGGGLPELRARVEALEALHGIGIKTDDDTAGSPGKPEDPPGKPEDPPGKPNKPGK